MVPKKNDPKVTIPKRLRITEEDIKRFHSNDVRVTTVEASSVGWVCPDCGNANLDEATQCLDCGKHRCCD